MMLRASLIFILLILNSCSDQGEDPNAPGADGSGPYSAAELAEIVEYTREKHGLPALGVLIQVGNEEPIVAVTGFRKLGAEEAATESDLWHIGSAAKSMTATLLATFVQDGAITFETTLFEIFPDYAEFFSPDAQKITVRHILSHTAGLRPNPAESPEELANLMADAVDIQDQREKVLQQAISGELLFQPGSDFSYSNTGYILAGAVIDRLGKKSYETLLAERVFEPLGVTEFGFGPPGIDENESGPNQPWGHRFSQGKLISVDPDDMQFHNPPIFNSAGNLHISLGGWAAYARDHLKSGKGQGIIIGQSLSEQLDMPATGESGYSMGWGVLVENGEPIMLTHNGSDGNWFADIRLYPYSDIVLLMVTNDGREDGAAKEATTRDIRRGFNKRYSPYP